MNDEINEQSAKDTWSSLSKSDARTVLSIAVEGSRRPVDRVIDCLVEDEQGLWLEEARARTQSCGQSYDAMLDGSASIDSLTELKNWCKAQVSSMHDTPQRDQFTLLYFLALASGLAHHATLISSRGSTDVTEALEALAPVLPAPECDLIARALKQADT